MKLICRNIASDLVIASCLLLIGTVCIIATALAEDPSSGSITTADSAIDPIACAAAGECPQWRGIRLAKNDTGPERTERLRDPLDQPTAEDNKRTLFFTAEHKLQDADRVDGKPSDNYLRRLRTAASAHFHELARKLGTVQCSETRGCPDNSPCKIAESFVISEKEGNGYSYEMVGGKVKLTEKWQFDLKCGCS